MTHALVLAGGFGTRLQGVVDDRPKPMALIADRPFLEYQFDYLIQQGITAVTLCTGHLSDLIEAHFGNSYKSLTIDYSIEDQPLGTGGAIKKALSVIPGQKYVAILNGDSYFDVDLRKMNDFHRSKNQGITVALKPMQQFDRYGTVVIDESLQITHFKEKIATASGWINGGVYLLNTAIIDTFPDQERFSFESYLNENAGNGRLSAFLSDSYFIDIGIPEDYLKSQRLLPVVTNRTFEGWTLFLDRDGVINVRTPGDYVKSMAEWEYCNDALASIQLLSFIFDRIIVVTNQQGVALGKMSSYTLEVIHQNLKDDVQQQGGHIDAVYASIDLKDKPNNSRKPNSTMGHWAKSDFPEISFTKSIIVGDSATDIEFGQILGMKTVCVEGKFEDKEAIQKLNPDWVMTDLAEFANSISSPNNIFEQAIQDLEILKT